MKDSFASSKFQLNLLPRIWELAPPLVPNRHQKPKGRKQRTFCWLPLLGNLVLLELRAGGKLHIAPSCPGPSKLQNPVVNRFISCVTGQFMLQMTESGMDGLADLGFFALCDVLPVSQLKWHLSVVSRTSGPTSLQEVKRNRDLPFKFMTKAFLVAKNYFFQKIYPSRQFGPSFWVFWESSWIVWKNVWRVIGKARKWCGADVPSPVLPRNQAACMKLLEGQSFSSTHHHPWRTCSILPFTMSGPEMDLKFPKILRKQLPHCSKSTCPIITVITGAITITGIV